MEIILDVKPLHVKAQEKALSTWEILGGGALELDWDGEMKQKKRRPLGHSSRLEEEMKKILTGEILRNNWVRSKKTNL